MSLNMNLVKPGIDDEEYQNACPTLGTLMLAHFSTPERHSADIYSADVLFFATHPNRRMYLRPAFPNEFDLTDSQERPLLHVLVSLMSPGFHEITPRWRGRVFWGELETDQSVAEAVMKMSLRGGLSVSSWYGYFSDQRARKSAVAKLRSKRRVN
jgi:hypothetical protein